MGEKLAQLKDKIGTIRQSVYDILEKEDNDDKLAVFVRSFIAIMIITNVIFVVFGSMDDLSSNFILLYTIIEIFSIVIFSLELFLRLWVSPKRPAKRKPYCPSIPFFIDLFAVLPFLLSHIAFRADIGGIFRIVRIFRFMRILKLKHFEKAYNVLFDVFKTQKEKLYMATVIFVIAILFSRTSPRLFPCLEHGRFCRVFIVGVRSKPRMQIPFENNNPTLKGGVADCFSQGRGYLRISPKTKASSSAIPSENCELYKSA